MRAHCSRFSRTSYAAASTHASSGKTAQRALHSAAAAPDRRAPPGLGVPAAQHLGCTLELAAAIRSASAVPDGARGGGSALGRCLHGIAVKAGRVASSAAVAKAVMDMYGRSGALADARLVFDEIARPDAVCWNILITASSRGGHFDDAVGLFRSMLACGAVQSMPTAVTVAVVVPACAKWRRLQTGRSVHGQCDRFDDAFRAFTAILNKDLISWNAILSACANSEQHIEGFFGLLGEMCHQWDSVTVLNVIRMSAFCGINMDANIFFRNLAGRNIVTDNIMISCYMKNNCIEDAESEGLKPDIVSITGVLEACIHLCSVQLVRQCHTYMLRASLEDIHLEGALLDAYSKCGNITNAYNIFQVSPKKDLVTFTAMIGCYAMHGMAEEAVELFSKMLKLGIRPDHVVLTTLLSACSHAGLVDAGIKIFKSIRDIHRIEPTAEHYACMVDLLARRGHLQDAYMFALDMPPHAVNANAWGSLLGACKVHGEIELGQLAADHLFTMEGENIGNYVIMSNIYAADEKWDGVEHVRKLMKSKDMKKPAGCSWIEVEKTRHLFIASDVKHQDRSCIYDMLGSLYQQIKDTQTQNMTMTQSM
ncbi:putative pentatricopeptide repeat-containing protein At5g08490 [Panicum virgatum]|uniref:putative pentatricopeptide repeat-containing protein At5g08490 n=1 Tax=Panicum virgatum TaxID=38727 RepID=UPI0019D51085|nr:putative pentatricopeptide repeat-containing protein At5g08490 [Panicum virgatum]